MACQDLRAKKNIDDSSSEKFFSSKNLLTDTLLKKLNRILIQISEFRHPASLKLEFLNT